MKIEQQRVLAGSLNLLTPSDKTPENDAIVLQNFRVDQQGVLRVADSFLRLTQVAGGAAAIHTIFKMDDFSTTEAFQYGVFSIQWGTGNNGIDGAFLIGAGTSLYFYWPGASGGAGYTGTLATGLSGNPLSAAVWNGFIWVLDSLQQLKIDPTQLAGLTGTVATATTPWLPAVPAKAITVAADTTGGGALPNSGHTFTYYCTYVKYGPTLSGGFLVAHESGPGPGTSAITPADGAISITALPYVTSSGSVEVDAIRVYRKEDSGTAYFLKQFGQGIDPTGAWCATQLTATYPSNDNSYADTVLAISSVAMPGSGGSGAPSAPSAALSAVAGFVSASSGLVGTYQYYETYVNSAGLETNPGPVSASVTPSNGLVDLSGFPTPPSGADVVYIRIYRTGGTLGNAYQVVQLPASATSYTDGFPDLALTENGIQMPTTNDPPPTGTAANSMGFAGPYFNYLLAWKDGKMYWSQNGVPLFPGSQDGSANGNWVNVGNSDDFIQQITLHPLLVAIVKQRSVWRLFGDPVTGELVNSGATCGAIGKQAVANCGTFDLILAPDGVYKFTMDANELMSDKIAPVFLGKQWIGLGASDLAQPNWGTPQLPFCAWLNGTALLGNGGANYADALGVNFVYHALTQRWAQFSSSYGNLLTAALGFSDQYEYFAGDGSGFLMVAQQVAGSANNAIWQTRFLDQGLGDEPKFYQEVVLDAELNGGSMQAWLLFDNTSAAPALSTVTAPYTATFSGTARTKYYMPLPQDYGDKGHIHISVRVQITALPGSVPPAIHGLYIYWATEERDASIRGTQVLDFRDERIQLCQRMEVDAVGQVNLTISTDEPNGLQQRYVFYGPNQGRAVFEFKLPPNVRGRLWQVTVNPVSTTARVYAIRGWMRQIGTAQAEMWQWKDFIRGTDAELPDAE